MNILTEKIIAVGKVHREFAKLMQNARCRTCSCFHADMLASILDTIQELSHTIKDHSTLIAAGRDFSQWLDEAGGINMHP